MSEQIFNPGKAQNINSKIKALSGLSALIAHKLIADNLKGLKPSTDRSIHKELLKAQKIIKRLDSILWGIHSTLKK